MLRNTASDQGTSRSAANPVLTFIEQQHVRHKKFNHEQNSAMGKYHECVLLFRYDAACLLLVYGIYIVVLCFDLRVSEFVLRKISPCCTCLGKGSGEKSETRPLVGLWQDDTSLRVHSRSRTDSGIFQDDSGYSHLSLSLHGLNEIPDGTL